MRSSVFSNSTRGIFLRLGDGREAAVGISFFQDEKDLGVRGHGVDRLFVGRVAGGSALGPPL